MHFCFSKTSSEIYSSAFRQQQKWASCIKSREQLSLLTQSANKCRTKVISGAWRTYSRPSPLQTWRWMHDPCLKNIAHEATAGCRAIEYFGLLDCPQKLPKTRQSLPSKMWLHFLLKVISSFGHIWHSFSLRASQVGSRDSASSLCEARPDIWKDTIHQRLLFDQGVRSLLICSMLPTFRMLLIAKQTCNKTLLVKEKRHLLLIAVVTTLEKGETKHTYGSQARQNEDEKHIHGRLLATQRSIQKDMSDKGSNGSHAKVIKFSSQSHFSIRKQEGQSLTLPDDQMQQVGVVTLRRWMLQTMPEK